MYVCEADGALISLGLIIPQSDSVVQNARNPRILTQIVQQEDTCRV